MNGNLRAKCLSAGRGLRSDSRPKHPVSEECGVRSERAAETVELTRWKEAHAGCGGHDYQVGHGYERAHANDPVLGDLRSQ